MNLTIRRAKAEALAAYTDLLQTTYVKAFVDESLGLTPACFSPTVFGTQDSQTYLKAHLLDTPTQKTWLAWDKEKLVGAITCTLQSDDEAELSAFYVRPLYQGQGLGKQLYEIAVSFAGKRDLLLDTYAHNTKAIAIYTKWGWQLDKSRGEDGYFWRHWAEWPAEVRARSVYMRRKA